MRIFASVLFVLFAACGGGGGGSGPADRTVGSATIGPEGGDLTVATGALAGLTLHVPLGALQQPTNLRVVEVADANSIFPNPQAAQLTTAPTPGDPFRIEPIDTEFVVPATLTVGYRPAALASTTAPGNVRARHRSALGEQRHVPDRVDAFQGVVAVDIRICGAFQIVGGPAVGSLGGYLPPVAGTTQLEHGVSVDFARVSQEPHLAGRLLERWTIDNGTTRRGIYVADFQQVGRFSLTDDWLEVNRDPLLIWRHATSPVETMPTSLTQVFAPIAASSATGAGEVAINGFWRFGEPMTIAGTLLLDVVELHVHTAWRRGDIGDGQDDLVFSFAPEHGIVALAIDGVLHLRTSL